MQVLHLAAAMTVSTLLLTGVSAQSGDTNPATTDQRQQRPAQPGASASPSGERKDTIAKQSEERQPPSEVRGQRPVHVALVTSPDRIVSDPASAYGARVSVHGQVGDVLSPHHFTLADDAWWSFGDNLMVVVPRPATQNGRVPDDAYVTVVGTVVPYVRAELERDYDWFDDLPDINIELDGRPVLVAEIARTSAGVTLTQPPAEKATHVLIADAGEIADVPGRFYGHLVSVRAEVEDIWSDRMFTLDEDNWFAGPDVLVVNPAPVRAGVAEDLEDETVTVIGVVRPFIRDEFDADYTWFNAADYGNRGISSYQRRPVIVASSIRSESGREFVTADAQYSLDRVGDAAEQRARAWTGAAGK